jgi:pimeloyl-ACP methyl ester carboxylesterase
MPLIARAGWPVYAMSMRGHGASGGPLRGARVSDFVEDVVDVATSLGEPPVLVGHSMGAVVVERAVHRIASPAAVLVAPAPAHVSVRIAHQLGRRHAGALGMILAGRPVPFTREDLLSGEVSADDGERVIARLGPESVRAQYEILLSPRPPQPAPCPVLVVASPDDACVPVRDVERTAERHRAAVHWFDGLGHDMMLEPRTGEVVDVVLTWLADTWASCPSLGALPRTAALDDRDALADKIDRLEMLVSSSRARSARMSAE